MQSTDDDTWNDTQLRFDAVVLSMRSTLRLQKALPNITLARTASDRLSARVRLASPGHVVVEFGAVFLRHLRQSNWRLTTLPCSSSSTVARSAI